MPSPWLFEHLSGRGPRGWLARRWYAHRVRRIRRALNRRSSS